VNKIKWLQDNILAGDIDEYIKEIKSKIEMYEKNNKSKIKKQLGYIY
jgi:hypothetical protein